MIGHAEVTGRRIPVDDKASMTHPRSKHFVALNNEGAYLVRNGLYAEAIGCFTSVVQHVEDLLGSTNLTTSGSTPLFLQGTEQRGDHRRSVDHQTVLEPSNYPLSTGDSLSVSLEDQEYIFRNPLCVLLHFTDGLKFGGCQQAIDERNQQRLLVAAPSNLALSHLLYGLKNNSVEELYHALFYYESAYRMLLLLNSDWCWDDSTALLSQTMIILNNVGHIHRILKNDELANQTFQHLLSTMILVQQLGKDEQIQDWDFFASSARHLMRDDRIKPAAAA